MPILCLQSVTQSCNKEAAMLLSFIDSKIENNLINSIYELFRGTLRYIQSEFFCS